ncbi:hypothetical protein RF11_13281 [Thelohanellus kitauei]|uniref:Uncharacterized protein n=1 Tax=Thelohanellus kitauei TaxID=669202 RepID=A0A0C2IFX6_THEKT|nr:hypothetical protein RF11_13281 [Thelohanellus kitauei]
MLSHRLKFGQQIIKKRFGYLSIFTFEGLYESMGLIYFDDFPNFIVSYACSMKEDNNDVIHHFRSKIPDFAMMIFKDSYIEFIIKIQFYKDSFLLRKIKSQ